MFKEIKFDKNLLILFLLLVSIGILLQYTANYPKNPIFFKNHLIWVGISLLLSPLLLFLSLHRLKEISLFLYLIGLFLLIIVIFLPNSDGRWIRMRGFQFQPSELMKIFFIIFIAKILSEFEDKKVNIKDLRLPIIVAGIPTFLVFIEPDIGTSAIFLFTFLGLIWTINITIPLYILLLSPLISILCGFHLISWILFMILLITTILLAKLDLKSSILIFLFNTGVGASAPVITKFLKPYQKARLLNFLNPSKDPTGAGWQLLQSKISIGSGGLWGKGYLNGVIKNLGFLPQTRTDFIFSVLGEEFGFIGTFAVIIIFTLFLLRILYIAQQAEKPFSKYLAYGIFFYFSSQVIINIAMTVGLLPVVGLPLPFLSYGGSSLLISTISISLLTLVKSDSVV
ncbi:MAG: FtsW/RodA/SpoVE family cell cycle protein [candidate division WOR-3 bacterium]